MPVRKSKAEWKGDLKSGTGTMSLASGAFTGPYSFASRFENGPGTNPEELIGAAHAGCFSMALAGILAAVGHTPESIRTEAQVRIDRMDDGFAITGVHLVTEASVPGIDEQDFAEYAETAKAGCPVSKALAVPITLVAKLA
ncbi:MAG: OsmC family protein [Armatimonadota bacterium]